MRTGIAAIRMACASAALVLVGVASAQVPEGTGAAVPSRPRFFRMPLDLQPEAEDGGRLQVQFGEDNPFLDLRKPTDPGGIGYQRISTQLQLFDSGSTGLVVGLQAVRPAGAEWEGLNDGPTVFSPAVGVVRELSEGTALQGFIGKDLRPGTPLTESFERNLLYGLALQTPLTVSQTGTRQGVSLFVEALGRYRHESDAGRTAPAAWEVLPGLHWRGGDSWWVSGGVLVPVGAGRPESGLLHINCALQF